MDTKYKTTIIIPISFGISYLLKLVPGCIKKKFKPIIYTAVLRIVAHFGLRIKKPAKDMDSPRIITIRASFII